MHYVTHISHQMQKHKFCVTCPDVFFMETTPSSTEQEKKCVVVSWHKRTEMHYVTHRSHWMQKYKFSVRYQGAFLSNPYRSHSKMKNSVLPIHAPDAPECTT
jgi:hypothetical protein